MKRTYHVILIGLFLLIYTIAYTQPTFQATTSSEFIFSQMQQAPDQDILVSYKNTISNLPIVVRSSKNGTLKWSRYYTGFTNPIIDIVTTRDNGFLAQNVYKIGEQYPGMVFKCDSLGNFLWGRIIDTAKTDPYSRILNSKICEAPDGNIYFITLDIHHYFQVMKLDKDGNVIWCKRFPYSVNMWNGLVSVCSGDDNGVVILINKGACESYCSYPYIHKLDENGNTEWGGDIYVPGNYTNPPMHVSYKDNKIGILLRADFWNTDYVANYCYWIYDNSKVKNTATLIPYNIFSLKEFLLSANHSQLSKLIVFDNYTYLGPEKWLLNTNGSLFHAKQDYSSPLKFEKFDTLNRLCPDYTVPEFSKETSTTQIYLGNTPYAGISKTVSIQNIEIATGPYSFLLSVNCSGSAASAVPANPGIDAASGESLIRLYPNPAINNLRISGLPLTGKTTMQIINAVGVLIKQIEGTAATVNLDVSYLTKGMYFIRINTGNTRITKTFVKN